jgi:hypothetical protein
VPSWGGRENFWGISCEKSLFYAKKSYFFQLRRDARKYLGYFVWKITILRQKIIFSPILGGPACAPRWIRPWSFHRCFLYKFAVFRQALSEENTFRNQPTRNKNCLWWPCLLTDRDEMSNLYRVPSIDDSYHLSVHFTNRFQRRVLEIDQA